ncbi:MAG: nucleotidyltransferase domain-containing protein [Planctomycetota bacterium]
MAAVVAREVDPEAIILFGSHATGSAGPDSDVDFMVIETEPFGPGKDRRSEMTRVWRALAGFAVAKDILVYSREEVERWRDARNHVIARALREGRLIYGSL